MRQRLNSASKQLDPGRKLELAWARFYYEATYRVSTRFCFEATGIADFSNCKDLSKIIFYSGFIGRDKNPDKTKEFVRFV